MANSFYDNSDSTQRLQPGTIAEGEAVDQKFDSVQTGFDGVEKETTRALKFPYVEGMASQEFEATTLQRRNKVLGFDSNGDLVLQDGFTYRGDWTADTDYFVNDVLRDPSTKNLYIVNLRFKSGTTFSTTNLTLGYDVAEIETFKNEAGTSATNAATSETNAAASRDKAKKWAEELEGTAVETGKYSALHHAAKASTSAGNAATSESNAATSASNAATSETNAASSASAASTSESNAATSETNAATSATNASGSELKAKDWAEKVEGSEVETGKYSALHHAAKASTSSSSAATSASNAATSETNAANSESNAATSANNAANSASAASTSETNAANSASAASTSEGNAAASLKTFREQYWGSHTSDPSTSAYGNAPTDGDLYYNTTDNVMKTFDAGTGLWGTFTPQQADETTKGIVEKATRAETVAAAVDKFPDAARVIEAVKQFGGQYTPDVNPSLDFDFARNDIGFYDPAGFTKAPIIDAMSVTRASTATYVDATGKIRTAAIDEPRLEYDSDTGEPLGLLVEEQRTNLLRDSEIFTNDSNSTVVATGVTVTADAVIAPDGNQTADIISGATDTNFGGTNVYKLTPTDAIKADGAPFYCSIWVKSEGATTFEIAIRDDDSGVFSRQAFTPGEWQRYEISRTAGATDRTMRLYIGGTDGDIAVWGSQGEQADFITSYIPTTTATVTRSVDNCTRVLGNEFNANEYTVYTEFRAGAGKINFVFALRTTADNRVGFYLNDGNVIAFIEANNSTRAITSPPTLSLNMDHKIAFCVKATGAGVAIDGVFYPISDGTLPVVNDFHIGNGGNYGSVNMRIPDVKMIPRAMTTTELEDMTR